jgi:hypothetical protein
MLYKTNYNFSKKGDEKTSIGICNHPHSFIHSSYCVGFELIVLGDSRSGSGNKNFKKTSAIIKDAIDYTYLLLFPSPPIHQNIFSL